MSLLNRLIKTSFGIAIFCIPLQLGIIIYQTAWGRGFINPYTSIYFSLTELLVLFTAVLFFIKLKKEKSPLKTGHKNFFLALLSIIGIIIISILFSPFQDTTFQMLLAIKVLELIIFYLLIVNKVMRARNILEIFIVSMSLQALLAIFQFTFQHSLGLQLVGEPLISAASANIARFTIGDQAVIRAYGTFSHPNILGGFLLVSLLCSLLFSPHLKHERKVLMLIQFLGLLLTFSRSAFLAFTVSIILISIWYLPHIKQFKNKLIPISLGVLFAGQFIFLALSRGLNILQDQSFLERLDGYKTAVTMFARYPFGVGFSHYTLFIDKISSSNIAPWEYQPVHNVLLLGLTETGIIGFFIALSLIIFVSFSLWAKRKKLLTKRQLFKKRILLVIVLSFFMIGMLDHYLISTEDGRLLLIMIFAIISSFFANPRHILPIKKGESLSKILAAQQ